MTGGKVWALHLIGISFFSALSHVPCADTIGTILPSPSTKQLSLMPETVAVQCTTLQEPVIIEHNSARP